jgi:hypothetical protein
MSDTILDVFLFCPVPDLQKPITEYIDIMQPNIKPSFFSLKVWPDKMFLFFLRFSFFLSFIFSFLLLSFLFKSAFLFCFFFFFIFYCFISIRKNQLLTKLLKPIIIYEINWYESSKWEKPLDIIKLDNFLALKCKQNWFEFFIFKN